MGFRGALFIALACFIVATRALGKSKSFGNVSGIRITDPNSIIENYSVDKEDCEKLCNLQALCRGFQVDFTGEYCELLADTDSPEEDVDYTLFYEDDIEEAD